jgi:PAS domain S-box-containing protein
MLQQMMSVDQVAIGLLTPERSALQIFDSDSNLIRELQLKAIPELEGFSQQIQPGPRVYYREDEVTSEQLLAFMSEFNVTMLAFIPMVVNNDLQGLIVLGNIASRYFTDGEWRLIEMSANQIATQLHNARLYRQTQDDLSRRLQQLALIEDIAQQISSTLNIEQLIQNVLEAAIRATQADVAMLGLVTETDDFRIIGKELLEGEWKQFEGTRAAKIGLMGQAARTGETLIINDNSEWSNYAPTLSSRTYGSSVVVPLIQKDVVIGVLNVESEKKTFFNDERIDFIKSLVGHAVISIQNTRLLQERQNRIETLTLLRDMSLRLSSDTDRESVMEAVLRTALDIFQGAEAVLFGYSGHNDTIELITSMRHDDLRHTDAHVPIPKSVIYRAAHSGGIDVVEDVRASEDFAKFEGMDAVKYVSVLIAPIKHGSRVEEILCVTLNHSLSYLNTDLNAVELLTIQAASHLENAALYKQIRSTNDRMRAILDSTRDGIILLDPKGQLIEANPSAENLLNIDLEDRMNENFAEILLGELQEGHTRNESMYDALTDMARTLRLRPKRITTRSIEIFKEGKTRYVEEVGSPVMDSKQRIMGRLLTLRDVTEERLLDAFRDEITNMVVHDLRGPLSSIISSLVMTLEILQEMTAGETMDTVAPMMEVSMNSAVNLLELVDSILDIAKLESRTMPLKRAPTSVEDLVTSAFAQLATSIQEADIVVEQDIPADLPLVDVDADKVRRVMVNLLDNAVRYTPNGGTVLLSAEKSGNHKVVIRICDSGAGIPSDEANRVFEKFRQIKENVPYHGSKGSGLGLTFCKLALEAHNESIWIEQNGPLSGATFAFTLPVVTPGSSIAPENVPVQAAPLSV